VLVILVNEFFDIFIFVHDNLKFYFKTAVFL